MGDIRKHLEPPEKLSAGLYLTKYFKRTHTLEKAHNGKDWHMGEFVEGWDLLRIATEIGCPDKVGNIRHLRNTTIGHTTHPPGWGKKPKKTNGAGGDLMSFADLQATVIEQGKRIAQLEAIIKEKKVG